MSSQFRAGLLMVVFCTLIILPARFLSLATASAAGSTVAGGSASAPLVCASGTPTIIYEDDFESGAPGWTNRGLWDNWEAQEWKARSGRFAWHAPAPATTSEKRLDSPNIPLPADAASLRLSFWHLRNLESDSRNCLDGGVLGISTDDGSTWVQVQNRDLIHDPYDAQIPFGVGNLLSARDAWCGRSGTWSEVLVNLDQYAGKTVRIRFHMGTDRTIASEGWYVDDVTVLACPATGHGQASTLLPLLHQDQALR
jgi:hypothetical protein